MAICYFTERLICFSSCDMFNLDGLHLDLRAEAPRIDLTWRGWIARCPAYLFAALSLASLAEAAGLPGCDEHGLAEAEAAA